MPARCGWQRHGESRPRQTRTFQQIASREPVGFGIRFVVRHAAQLSATVTVCNGVWHRRGQTAAVLAMWRDLRRRQGSNCDVLACNGARPRYNRRHELRSVMVAAVAASVFSTPQWRRRSTRTRSSICGRQGKPAFGVYAPNERPRDPNAPPPGPGAAEGQCAAATPKRAARSWR